MGSSGGSTLPDFIGMSSNNHSEYIGRHINDLIESNLFDRIDRRIQDVQKECNSRLSQQDAWIESIRKDCDRKIERGQKERSGFYFGIVSISVAIIGLAAAIAFKK